MPIISQVFDAPTSVEEVRTRLRPYLGHMVRLNLYHEGGSISSLRGVLLEGDGELYIEKANPAGPTEFRKRDVQIATLRDLTPGGEPIEGYNPATRAEVELLL
ncbi:MAG: hypothetical protein FJY76_04300 [Candidatus Aenigmarchaeota archaeon]|nr:hypothetical protein [Candidatus Aenigmarchaeota archaeon]